MIYIYIYKSSFKSFLEERFTTLTCIPGVIYYNDIRIQLLDLPGLIVGAFASPH